MTANCFLRFGHISQSLRCPTPNHGGQKQGADEAGRQEDRGDAPLCLAPVEESSSTATLICWASGAAPQLYSVHAHEREASALEGEEAAGDCRRDAEVDSRVRLIR